MSGTLDSFLGLKPVDKRYFYYDSKARTTRYIKISQLPKNIKINIKKTIKWREIKEDIIFISDWVLEGSARTNNNLNNNKFKTAVVKSNLQKAIRKGDLNKALASTKYLFDVDPLVLIRRLMIIMLEDVIPTDDFPTLLFMMVVYPDWIPNQQDLAWLLRIVEQLVSCNYKEYTDKYFLNDDKKNEFKMNLKILQEIEDDTQIRSGNEKTFLISLLLRASYGGLKGDIKMIYDYFEQYSKESPTYYENHLIFTEPEHNMINLDTEFKEKLSLTPDLILDESIDFHTNPYILHELSTIYDYQSDFIKKLIWYFRSSLNYRYEGLEDKIFKRKNINEWKKIENGVSRMINNIKKNLFK